MCDVFVSIEDGKYLRRDGQIERSKEEENKQTLLFLIFTLKFQKLIFQELL